MKDHSLVGYLKRRSTEELKAMLAYYLRGSRYASYRDAIAEIQNILQERGVPGFSLELLQQSSQQEKS